MKAANNALHRKRLVILDKFSGNSSIEITPTVVRFAEIAPFVAPYVRLDDFYTGYLRFDNVHIAGYYTKTAECCSIT